jgi:hypothetical protein
MILTLTPGSGQLGDDRLDVNEVAEQRNPEVAGSFTPPNGVFTQCGNNSQGRSLITFIQSRQFESQINTNWTQCETPAFIPIKWADPLWRSPSENENIKQFYVKTENWREITMEQRKGRENVMNMIKYYIQYFPQQSWTAWGSTLPQILQDG